jgi:hypothetical protein
MGKKDKKSKKEGKKKVSAVGKAPTYTKQANVEDFLDETQMNTHETYGCVMFASPGESMREQFKEQIATSLGLDIELVSNVVDRYTNLEHPKRAFKYVGGRGSIDECANRIKQIMAEEASFHIYTIENGKWCTFDPSPELIQNENYREEQLNEIIKGTKMVEERTKDFFRSEMRKKVEKARLEGTKEGQQILLEAEEPYQAVQFRAESADKNIKEMQEKIAELERSKLLAVEKMTKYREQGKDKIDPRDETDRRLDDLKNTNESLPSRDAEIRGKLEELKAIEKQAVIPDNATSKMAQQLGGGSNSAMFDSEPIIPSAEK